MHCVSDSFLSTVSAQLCWFQSNLIKFVSMRLTSSTFTALQDNKFFEDAFKVYERGVQVFKYPHVRPIWSMYLNKFVSRYGGKKLERARDLFEQALKEVHEFIFLHMYQFL